MPAYLFPDLLDPVRIKGMSPSVPSNAKAFVRSGTVTKRKNEYRYVPYLGLSAMSSPKLQDRAFICPINKNKIRRFLQKQTAPKPIVYPMPTEFVALNRIHFLPVTQFRRLAVNKLIIRTSINIETLHTIKYDDPTAQKEQGSVN